MPAEIRKEARSDLVLRLRILYALRDGPLGRRRLATKTHLGEMVVRQTVERMRADRWVRVERAGIFVDEALMSFLDASLAPLIAVHWLALEVLGDQEPRPVAQLRAGMLPAARKLRDACVAAGGSGLVVLRWSDGAWRFSHDAERFDRQNPRDAEQLRDVFGLAQADDLLLIVSAAEAKRAAAALWGSIAALLRPKEWRQDIKMGRSRDG